MNAGNPAIESTPVCPQPGAGPIRPGHGGAGLFGSSMPLIVLLLLAVAHYGLAPMSTLTVASPFHVSLLWLPAGLGVAACLALAAWAAVAVLFAARANNLQYDTSTLAAICGTSPA